MLRIITGLLLFQYGVAKIFKFPVLPYFANIPPLIVAAGTIELILGALLIVGLFTRLTAFILSGQMAFAYFLGHMFKAGAPVCHPRNHAAPDLGGLRGLRVRLLLQLAHPTETRKRRRPKTPERLELQVVRVVVRADVGALRRHRAPEVVDLAPELRGLPLRGRGALPAARARARARPTRGPTPSQCSRAAAPRRVSCLRDLP